MQTVAVLISLLLLSVFWFESLKYELMCFQQNSYRPERYWNLLKKELTGKRYLLNYVLLIAYSVTILYFGANLLLAILAFIVAGRRLQKKYKKPVAFTARVYRLCLVSFLIVCAAILVLICFKILYFIPLVLLCAGVFASVILLVANILLLPVDKYINYYYYKDAEKILRSMPDLKIIGITGSYGKTSTKHFLYRILSEKYNVLMTPGNFNTTLGVIRTIREQLKSYHEIFIVEMGAKQLGDIKEICDLVNPSIGIITAVGEQHLETFKSIQNIQKTKFELMDALPASGLSVLNYDYEYIANRDNARSAVKNVVYYSMDDNPKADYYVKDVRIENGKNRFFVYSKEGLIDTFETGLLGKYNVSNLLACYIVATYLKVDRRNIKNAITEIQPVEHRLSLKETSDKITIIDDAYNSNPIGAKMALEVLSEYKGGKKIIITPGMVELGEKQYVDNREFGEYIAKFATHAIIVGQYNREALENGLKMGGFEMENYHFAPTLIDATIILKGIIATGDVVLYENDLPDTFK